MHFITTVIGRDSFSALPNIKLIKTDIRRVAYLQNEQQKIATMLKTFKLFNISGPSFKNVLLEFLVKVQIKGLELLRKNALFQGEI